MKDWYVVVDGKPAGPYMLEELKVLGIKPGTFVKTAGMDDYKEAHEIPALRQFLGFAKFTALPQYYASLDIRLLAVAIDYFLIALIYALLTVVIIMIVDGQFLRFAISAAGLILIPLTKLVYAILLEGSARQGTYAKSWLGLKVCDEQGLPVDFAKSLIRNLSKLLSIATLGIGYLMGFFSRRQQCLHDRIAGTLVVKDRLL